MGGIVENPVDNEIFLDSPSQLLSEHATGFCAPPPTLSNLRRSSHLSDGLALTAEISFQTRFQDRNQIPS